MTCFLLLVAGLAVATQTLLVVTPPLFFWLFKVHCSFRSVIPLLKRLRWLFLSLFILNLWFYSATFSILPNIEGLFLALEKVAVLIVIVLAAHLLLQTTSLSEIITTVQWFLRPLNQVGIQTEKLAVRMALVLDIVKEVQNFYAFPLTTTSQNPIEKISDKLVGLLNQVLIHAEMVPLQTLEIPPLQSPPWWQWSYPGLMIVLIGLGL